MTNWFVTRHPNASMWASKAGISVSDNGIVRDLDLRLVKSGDVVMGTLPVNLAAEVVEKGARYLHLSLKVPPAARGRELTLQEMQSFGARIEEFRVERVDSPPFELPPIPVSQTIDVQVCIASAQALQNLIPLLVLAPNKLYIAVSDDKNALRSAQRIADLARICKVDVVELLHTPSAPLVKVRRFADEVYGRIRKEVPGARIVLNATGGTKIMSGGFATSLQGTGEVIYCDTEHGTIEFLSPEGREQMQIQPELINLELAVRAQGFDVAAIKSTPQWLEEMNQRAELTLYLMKHAKDIGVLLGRINRAAEAAQEKLVGRPRPFTPNQTLEPCNSTPEHNTALSHIDTSGLWERRDDAVVFSSNAAAIYLAGGWMEEYAAIVMSDLGRKRAIPDGHWGVGVTIQPTGARGRDFNEIDLAVVWNNRMLLVECKTGVKICEGQGSQDILNKIEAIKTYAAGVFGTKWLLSARLVEKGAIARRRAEHYGIRIINPGELHRLEDFIGDWMNGS